LRVRIEAPLAPGNRRGGGIYSQEDFKVSTRFALQAEQNFGSSHSRKTQVFRGHTQGYSSNTLSKKGP
jgi:hypothetical protein